MDMRIVSLAERPDLVGALWQMPSLWPRFMTQDPVSDLGYAWMVAEAPEYVSVALDGEGRVLARSYSVPFALGAEGRDGVLPERGWDQVLLWAMEDRRAGRTPDTVSAIEISVARDVLGRGLSARMLAAMRDRAGELGYREVVAPVRPNGKHLEPRTPMAEYALRTRPEDGLPHDPWLRVHVRAGGVVDSVAAASMTISGTVERWREWTGLPFDADGPVEVPFALVPVRCEASHGYAVYVEPNVWVRHRL
ncbi:N-acetyltransferase [Streptomyces sudanensis]|uniref:N-acetyltransferase n=1 Tax=Streptomyces sudanensis TaxID=436397 RepID=UPI0020CD54A5|nr:N-acetyltransferase [Streptomyces sudanensis]MCP9987774.1 N-acetyltransferase [Streptomyces sudanensis]